MIIRLKFECIQSLPYPYYPCSKHGFNCKTCCGILVWPNDAIVIAKKNLEQFNSVFDLTSMCINQEKKYCIVINKNDKIFKICEETLIIGNKETKIFKCFLNGIIFWSVADYFLEL
jgi:hypothetical protein